MKLIFGLEIDDLSVPRPKTTEGGVHYCGRKGLLTLLEAHLALAGHPDDIEYLRIEQYRQALLRHLTSRLNHQSSIIPDSSLREGADNQPFYKASFEADQFATATELLSRRDELVLAGVDFTINEGTPPRLLTIAQIEQIFKTPPPDGEQEITLSTGYADRFKEVLEKLDLRRHPFTEIALNEPFELLPCHFQKLFKKIEATTNGLQIRQLLADEFNTTPVTDLQKFQSRLQPFNHIAIQPSSHSTIQPSSDGSLLVLKTKRAGEAASYLAKIFRLNPSFRPACVVPEKNRTLDIALIQEGLPSLGIQSASLARPTLQILKLAPTFLWEPVDPFKILEFVSLSVKPLADDLAILIANQVAQSPGLKGEGWYTMINRYFDDLAEDSSNANGKKAAEARRQYNFWFERQRYDMDKTVPKSQVIEIFSYLREWSLQVFEDFGGKNHSLLVLAEQSRRIVELLHTLPETELTHLELERIVRTIYEPSPVVFQEKELGHLPFAMHPGAFIRPVEEVLWWNFVQPDPPHFFSRWYRQERDYLDSLGIHLDTPQQENARQLWQRTRPVLLAKNRLVLVLPETVNGEEVPAHPLFGDLQATFKNLDAFTFNIDTETGKESFEQHFKLPKKVEIEKRQLGRPRPFLNIRNLGIPGRDYETLTSLESLFYYPYQWVFKYKIRLNKSSILSVVKDHTLMGNLAHRVFEKLLREDIYKLDKPALETWVEKETRHLLSREGAVLLMYGREPERIAFIKKLKYAAWSLINHIRENGWKVKRTEMDLEGVFPVNNEQATPVKGIADIVLERGDELAVVDLKWRGATRRENMLRNGEDLQLVLYSRLLSAEGQWAHTAYFIIENGKLLARNNLAFRKITPLVPDTGHREINEKILASMEATWHWRMNQLARGQIEIRCRQTMPDIEDAYAAGGQAALMMDILEMPGEDARYDDFRTLINLIE